MEDSSAYQLYHILNVDTISFCLICMEDICDKLSFESTEDPIQIHLRGTNHQENVKFLFKLCIPDLIDDESSTEGLIDIMTRSVFDISHLLGKKTCYISCVNENHLVCLLCREEVSEMDFSCKKIKKKIISHLQKDKHLNSVKTTNWIYHFNSFNSFFRFHKSLLYCSICKESFQIEEFTLLQFADSHLKNRHNVSYTVREEGKPQDMSQAKGDTETSDFAEGVSSGSNNSSCSSSSAKNPSSKSGFHVKKKKFKSFICHLCLGDIEITKSGVRYSIDDHFMNHHLQCFQDQGTTLFKEIIVFNQRFLDHNAIVRKYPGISVLSDCVPAFGNNSKNIQIFENLSFCRLCSAMVSFDSDTNDLLRNFSTHFQSPEHLKVLKRKGDTGFDKASKKKIKNVKRLQQTDSQQSSEEEDDSKKSKKT